MRTFDSIELPPELHPSSLSVTNLQRGDRCLRSLYLSLLYKGGAASHAMLRGSAVHTAIERCLRLMVESGEDRIPGDVARQIANEVIEEGVFTGRDSDLLGRLPLPLDTHDFIRMCVFRWAEHFVMPPERIVAVEQMMELDLGEWTIRGKVDLITVGENRSLEIRDWKSSRALPAFEDVAVMDNGLARPKDFQLIAYALLADEGEPVEWIPCGACHETRATDPFSASCEACEGRGGAWMRKRRWWPRVDRYELSLVYPAIEVDGLASRGPLTLQWRDLHDYMQGLKGLVNRVGGALLTGDWPAVPGSHCAQCPASFDCPLGDPLREYHGSIRDLTHAEILAEELLIADVNVSKIKKALKAWAVENGVELIRAGSDKGYGLKTKTSYTTDWDRLNAESAQGPVDIQKYRKRRDATSLDLRKLSDEERSA